MSRVQPAAVTDFFEADAANWDTYYERQDVFSVIHQLRRSLALAWVDELSLATGAEVLEVGCGTGLFAIELARRGLRVTAVDAANNMLERARKNLARAGVQGCVTLMQADGEQVPIAAGRFELAVALGLLPWVPSPVDCLREMVRAVAPAGHLLVSCDNTQRLTVLLDPRYTPALARVRVAARRLLGRDYRGSPAGAFALRHSPRQLNEMLGAVGVSVRRSQTFGFGPLTVMGRELLPARASVMVHRALQRLADRGLPGFRWTGTQYLVLARAG